MERSSTQTLKTCSTQTLKRVSRHEINGIEKISIQPKKTKSPPVKVDEPKKLSPVQQKVQKVLKPKSNKNENRKINQKAQKNSTKRTKAKN